MKRRQFVLAAPAVVGGSMLVALGARANTPSNVIRFGQSASMTGGQAAYGRDVRDGIAAAFAAASAQPGSPRFELLTMDDGGVRSRCAQNVNFLIDSGVSAVVGLTSGTCAEASMPAIEKAQLALLGTASGNMSIRTQSGAAYHVRAGYDLEYRRMTAYMKDFGMRRAGVVTLDDVSPASIEVMTAALGDMGMAPKLTVAINRNAPASNFDGAAAQLIDAKLDCVLFMTNASPAAAIIERMNAAKYPGLFYASSFAGQDLIDMMVTRKQSCVLSVVVPRPNAAGVGIVAQCGRDLATHVPGAKVGTTTLEGYIAGRTAIEAARTVLKASGSVTRGKLREALAGLHTDFGGYRVEFAAGSTQGSRYVDLVTTDRFGRLVG